MHKFEPDRLMRMRPYLHWRVRVLALVLLMAGLVSCEQTAQPTTVAPTPTERIKIVTQVLVVTATAEEQAQPTEAPAPTEAPLATEVPAPTDTPAPPMPTQVPLPTETPTPPPTPMPVPTDIPAPPTPILTVAADVRIEKCDSSTDRRLGHVKDAWVSIQNTGNVELTQVQLVLDADDRDSGTHPDQTKWISQLQPGARQEVKMTVDTKSRAHTNLYVTVSANERLQLKVTYWCDK